MTPEQAITEARARIIWGESALLVREFLVSNGLSAADADSKIEAFCAERILEIRTVGRRRTLIGAVILLIGGVAIYPCYKFADASTCLGGIRIILLLALIGLVGFCKVISGVICLARPQSEHRAISEISE